MSDQTSSIRSIKGLIEDEDTLRMAMSEFLSILTAEMLHQRNVFQDCYQAFCAVLLNFASEPFDVKMLKQIPRLCFSVISSVLPYIEEKPSFRHQELSNFDYALEHSYTYYSSVEDIGEIYSIFLIYSYSLVKLRVSTWGDVPSDKRDRYLELLRQLIIDCWPYTDPKLKTLKTGTIGSKYLDDNLNEVSEEEVISRFLLACGRKDSRMALKLLGDIRRIEPEHASYYEAYIDYQDERYEDALHYLDNVRKGQTYYHDAINLKLNSLAMLGREEDFFKLINSLIKSKIRLNQDYVYYCTQLLILNSKDCSDNIYKKITSYKRKFSKQQNPYYRNCIRRYSYRAMINGLNILRNYGNETIMDESLNLREIDKKNLQKYNKVAQFLWCGTEFFFTGNNKRAMDYGSTFECTLMNAISFIRDKYAGSTNKTLPDASLDDYLFAFNALYDTGEYEDFYIQVMYHFDYFKSLESLPNVRMTLERAYVEGCALGRADNELVELVNSWHLEKEFANEINISRMKRILPSNAWKAYEAAEWQFSKSKEEYYDWKDAGMISLAYFRIIEMVLNYWIIVPLAKNKGTELSLKYSEQLSQMSSNQKNSYKFKWRTIIKSLKDIENNPSGEGMMLGPMEYLFRNIGSEYTSDDEVATIIINELGSILNSGWEQAVQANIPETLISKSVRDKYRNPPAHCKYLSYDIACECRTYTTDALMTIHSWV